MTDYSKLISMLVLAFMALAGLVVIVYDLVILNSSNFPMITGYLLGIPVAWAMHTLGIQVGIDAIQNALNTSSTINTTTSTQETSTPVSPMQGH